MRWEDLIADVEAQFAGELDAQFRAEVADRTRSERASVELASRLVAAKGTSLTVVTRGGEMVAGVVVDAASQWVLIGATGRQELVSAAAIAHVVGLGPQSSPLSETAKRLTLGHALRGISRDRQDVAVSTTSGLHVGRIDAVGRDYADVTGSAGTLTVPFTAIEVVRSH